MVFFTCNACGQSLKKSHVEKHCTIQCRNCEMLSCMDCGKDFWGEEYKTHVKCISEEEKYSGKDFKAKANKGEEKQESWMQLVHTTINTSTDLAPDLLNFLRQLVTYTNVPRKKSKFENYVRNSMRIKNENLISRAWDVFDSAHKSASEQKAESSPATLSKVECETPASEEKEKKKKKKKSKGEEADTPIPEAEALADDNDTSTKKKHKKRKHSTVEDEPPTEIDAVEATTPQAGTEEKKKKKKRKSGVREESEAIENGEGPSEKVDETKVEELNEEGMQGDGEEKKGKKQKKKKNVELEGEAIGKTESDGEKEMRLKGFHDETEKTGEGKKSKKRKSGSVSVEPELNGVEENKKHNRRNGVEVEEQNGVKENGEEMTNGEVGDSSKKRKKEKKGKKEEPEQEANGEEVVTEKSSSQKPSKFKWAKVAETLLLQTPEKALQAKKLKKKIFAEYLSRTPDASEDVKPQLEELFASKVTNNERFQLEGKTIKLVA